MRSPSSSGSLDPPTGKTKHSEARGFEPVRARLGADGSTDEQSDFALKVPQLLLPKGGGALKGIGEKFAANPVNGTASMTVPIATSPGRGGFGPELSLSYSSGGGNGPFGLGWQLSVPSIQRKTDKGLPQYDDAAESDVFILAGAEDLVPVLEEGGTTLRERFVDARQPVDFIVHRYRPRVEGLFARIERWTHRETGEISWRVMTRDNVTHLYGWSSESRIADPRAPSARVFAWLLCESYDNKGNAIVYRYTAEDTRRVPLENPSEQRRSRGAQRYLTRVCYGNRLPILSPRQPRVGAGSSPDGSSHLRDARWLFEVVFDYEEGRVERLGRSSTDGHLRARVTAEPRSVWETRPDPFSQYRPGFEVRTYRRCRRVLMLHHFDELTEDQLGSGYLVRSTEFEYMDHRGLATPDVELSVQDELDHPGSSRFFSFIRRVTQVAYERDATAALETVVANADASSTAGNLVAVTYLVKELPPLDFDYSRAKIQDDVQLLGGNDELPRRLDAESARNIPQGVDGVRYRFVDLDGEGVSGILTEQGGAWYYKEGRGNGTFGPLVPLPSTPNRSLAEGGQQLMDLSGNGQLDLVALGGPLPGFFERTTNEDWEPFRPFESLPRLDFKSSNLRMIDLTGDGHADVLITEDDVLTWHPSLETRGFSGARHVRKASNEDLGPRLVFSNQEETIHLADFSGDGLTDLVRVRNGEVCYWPNLGYGRFGAKVVMDHSPKFDKSEHFDPARLRLADIDGSGTTDLIYLHTAGIRIYFNQSGNRLTAARELRHLPSVDRMAEVTTADLLGNGTACLVWSSHAPADAHQPLRYIDLMGGQKPHLLVGCNNNLGLTTEVHYVSSTQFYLADKQAGQPWITKLSFPVHCVQRVTVKDKWRRTTFSTTYSYHHGHFDGVEREFRGFGRVEQVDVEDFSTFAAGNTTSPFITGDQTLFQPPIKTVTWYHTGALAGRGKALRQYEQEYFPQRVAGRDPGRALEGGFAERAFPELDWEGGGLSGEEFRQALRACKGMTLRQEVYELDVDALAEERHQIVKLFSAAHHSCHVRRLQGQGTLRHAVFLVTESEALTYHYELNISDSGALRPDPRVTHTLNLTVDDFGNILQSVSVGYPRRSSALSADSSLTDPLFPLGTAARIRAVQGEVHIAYTETRLTGPPGAPGTAVEGVHSHRAPVPCEVLSFELTGVEPSSANSANFGYFTLDDFRSLRLSPAHQASGIPVDELAYHLRASVPAPQKRLVEHVRNLFWSDTLSGPLPLGEIDPLGLSYETYKLALTEDLLGVVLGGDGEWRLNPAVLASLQTPEESGYFRFPGEDALYWIRSGVAGFADDAQDHFYLPERYVDAFGNETTLHFDEDYHLFLDRSSDPLANTVSVDAFDFRVLSPIQVRDQNDNLSVVAFDVLGMPSATAVMGKGGQGDVLDAASTRQLSSEESGIVFEGTFDLNGLRALLGTATSRLVYSFGERLQSDGSVTYAAAPPSSCSVAREIHHAEGGSPPELRVQVSWQYSDAGGNVLLQKSLAEPEQGSSEPRFLTSGKTVLNNKGKPVKQYEPYFSGTSQRFELTEEIGVTPILYYDALGRVIRTEQPDGSYSRVEFSPWEVRSFDQNDTLNEPENPWMQAIDALPPGPDGEARRAAASQALRHAATPGQVFLDSLGREVIVLAHNRFTAGPGDPRTGLVEEKYETFTRLDGEGKPLYIRDARGNLVMQYVTPPLPNHAPDVLSLDATTEFSPCYDIAGNLLMQHGMDGGARWMLHDAAGNPLYLWDENTRGTEDSTLRERRSYRHQYDELRRPLGELLSIDGGPEVLLQRWVYGDDLVGQRPFGGTGPEPAPNAKDHNLRGQLYRHFDSSGLRTQERYDFKGAEEVVTHRLLEDATAPFVDWGTLRLGSDSNPDPAGRLQEVTYRMRAEQDALGRMKRLFNWHRVPEPTEQARVTVYLPEYNQRGLLQAETVHVAATLLEELTWTHSRGEEVPAISAITYNEKGQRLSLRKGNGTLTRYSYDEKTFRLTQLRTAREGFNPAFPEYRSDFSEQRLVQQLRFTYDAVGNITQIYDGAFAPEVSSSGEVHPVAEYKYDALYRLIEAAGREEQTLETSSDTGMPQGHRVGSPGTLRPFRQHFVYDAVGNIDVMAHRLPIPRPAGEWTRHYEYAADSNRLLATWLRRDRSDRIDYRHDLHGSHLNLANVEEEQHTGWDIRDMIHRLNLVGGGEAFYQYGAKKQRCRKFVRRSAGDGYEHIYLGGLEVRREFDERGETTEVIETHHLYLEDERTLLIEDIRETNNPDLAPGVLLRYQYGNHLDTVGLELDGAAAVLSYEEFHPYGTTAYQLYDTRIRAAKKRYRYTGMERDEESGLCYHTARYYVPWLGRWGSVDPAGLVDGGNLLRYGGDHPVKFVDRTGRRIVTTDIFIASFNRFDVSLNEDERLSSYRESAREQAAALYEQIVRSVSPDELELFQLSDNGIAATPAGRLALANRSEELSQGAREWLQLAESPRETRIYTLDWERLPERMRQALLEAPEDRLTTVLPDHERAVRTQGTTFTPVGLGVGLDARFVAGLTYLADDLAEEQDRLREDIDGRTYDHARTGGDYNLSISLVGAPGSSPLAATTSSHENRGHALRAIQHLPTWDGLPAFEQIEEDAEEQVRRNTLFFVDEALGRYDEYRAMLVRQDQLLKEVDAALDTFDAQNIFGLVDRALDSFDRQRAGH